MTSQYNFYGTFIIKYLSSKFFKTKIKKTRYILTLYTQTRLPRPSKRRGAAQQWGEGGGLSHRGAALRWAIPLSHHWQGPRAKAASARWNPAQHRKLFFPKGILEAGAWRMRLPTCRERPVATQRARAPLGWRLPGSEREECALRAKLTTLGRG